MGLFDKRKKGDDFDSPVENIDLNAPPAEPEPQAIPTATAAERHIDADLPPDDDFDAPAYGINDAIQLMRALPSDNVELVVQVVKRTLESTRVKVRSIIDDATRKQGDIEGRIDVLKKEIAEFEQEIRTRKEEIEKLEADHKETSLVKERLLLAEKLTDKPTQKAAARPAASTTTPPATAHAKPATAPAPAPAATGATSPGGSGAGSSGSSGSSGSGGAGGAGGAGGTSQRQTTAKGTTIVAKK